MKSRFLTTASTVVLSIGIFIASFTNANAVTVRYTLDNIFLNTTDQMTGSFEWVYNEGDFENGTGKFTELFIPGTRRTLAELNITFDISNSIEFTLINNIDNDGVDITLFLATPLTPTTSSLLDLGTSKWSLGGAGINNSFNSGGITLTTVPLPLASWLFCTGFIGLVGIAWRKKS